MPLACVQGVVIVGVQGIVVRVEVAVSDGLPSVGVVGLPDASVAESRWRARCAVEASGRKWPNRRITVSLSPAEVRKHGAGLDLPMAIGILAADGAFPPAAIASTALIGELGLDGRVRPSRGMLAAVPAARQVGLERVIVASRGTAELEAVSGISIVRAHTLHHVCAVLEGRVVDDEPVPGDGDDTMDGADATPHDDDREAVGSSAALDLADVRGHLLPRWAVEVAAAGGHHLAMVGPPGVGKTLLVERLPGLLPPLSDDDSLEVAAIHSVAGLPRSMREIPVPPLSAPHHSASASSLLGSVHGGRVLPGAVTMAHRGVLLLDEAPEFARPVLEGLRQPLESGVVSVNRTSWSGLLPARFQLAITANPCPCGKRIGTGAGCSCSPSAVRRYAARLSGPLMDRIDIRLAVNRPSAGELDSAEPSESSATVRARVQSARERMSHRLASTPWRVNAQVPAGELRRRWPLRSDGADLLAEIERGSENLRGVDRVLRVSWTLADLRKIDAPGRDEVAGALALRGAHAGLAS